MNINISLKNILKSGTEYSEFKNRYCAFIFRLDGVLDKYSITSINNVTIGDISSLTMPIDAEPGFYFNKTFLTDGSFPKNGLTKYLGKFNDGTYDYYVVFGFFNNLGQITEKLSQIINIQIELEEIPDSNEIDFQLLQLELCPNSSNCDLLSKKIGNNGTYSVDISDLV